MVFTYHVTGLSDCVESYTVVHDRQREARAIVVGRLLATDARFVALTTDAATMRAMKTEEFLGREVELRTDAKGVGRFAVAALKSSKL